MKAIEYWACSRCRQQIAAYPCKNCGWSELDEATANRADAETELAEANIRNAKLEAKVAALRSALKPFVEVADRLVGSNDPAVDVLCHARLASGLKDVTELSVLAMYTALETFKDTET